MRIDDDLQKQGIKQLNSAIEVGLSQLKRGDKVLALEAYRRVKKKIENIAKNLRAQT